MGIIPKIEMHILSVKENKSTNALENCFLCLILASMAT